MKILEVSPYFYPVIGGLERAILFLSKSLARLGHEIHICTTNVALYDQEKLDLYEILDELIIHRVPSMVLSRNIELGSPISLHNILKSEFDIIHLHTHLSLLCLEALIFARLFSLPFVLTCMAVNTVPKSSRLLIRTFGSTYERVIARLTKRAARQILVRSKRDERILLEKFSLHNVKFIPDGVPNYCLSSYDGQRFREKYDVKSENIVLFIGRMNRLKGPQVLIRSVPYVVKEFPDTSFIFIGPDDGVVSKLSTMIRAKNLDKYVRMAGIVTEVDKMSALAACKALVIPSLLDVVEVYPMVMSEAWAQEKPVIASAVGGIPFRIKNGKNGLLVPPNDSVKLADAIRLVLEDKGYAKKMGQEGRKNVSTWDDVAGKIEKIYYDCI